ncbi:MAG: MarR family winged helix-turn-helix transcriptional regulator [Ramlibacter sp.]
MVNYQMNRISNLNGANVRRLCEGEFGITRTEWEFLSLLCVLGPTPPSDLASYARLDRSLTSKVLRSLRDKKLVQKNHRSVNGRYAQMAITDAGKALHERLLPRVAQINAALLEGLSADDVERLSALLQVLARRAQDLVHSELVEGDANRRQGGSRRMWATSGSARTLAS